MAVYFNDQFINDEDALLHVSDLSMQRGYALFDFFRTVNGKPLFMHDHLERFYASSRAMHLDVGKSTEELERIVHELIRRSSLEEAGIRLTLTGGYSPNSYTPAAPNLMITCNPVKTSTVEDFEKGYSIITYPHQRELPHIKSINYQMAVWLQPLIKDKGADDVLYHNEGIITEFPRSNIFVISKENKLLTPSVNILFGITRKMIIGLARDTMTVEEKDISIDDLHNASEAFLTSTTKKIIPIIKVDDKKIGDGKPGMVSRGLLDKLNVLIGK